MIRLFAISLLFELDHDPASGEMYCCMMRARDGEHADREAYALASSLMKVEPRLTKLLAVRHSEQIIDPNQPVSITNVQVPG